MEWYYTKDGVQVGPLTQDDLVQKISVGEVSSNQLAWHDGMSEWQPISSLPQLQITSGGGQAPPTPLPPAGQAAPYGAPAAAKTSGLAIASVCLGAGSVLLCGIFLAIPAIICGHMALAEIKRSGGVIQGKAMAIVGLVIGYLITLVSVVAIAFVLLMPGAAMLDSDSDYSYEESLPEDYSIGSEPVSEDTSE